MEGRGFKFHLELGFFFRVSHDAKTYHFNCVAWYFMVCVICISLLQYTAVRFDSNRHWFLDKNTARVEFTENSSLHLNMAFIQCLAFHYENMYQFHLRMNMCCISVHASYDKVL